MSLTVFMLSMVRPSCSDGIPRRVSQSHIEFIAGHPCRHFCHNCVAGLQRPPGGGGGGFHDYKPQVDH